jgi:NTE family protein
MTENTMNDAAQPTLEPKPERVGPVVGLALGSGSARGWAHIGVIQGLEELGISPQVVCGTSIGALVGAVYVSGELDAFAEWVGKLTSRDVMRLLDFSFSGGMVKGETLFKFFEERHRNPDIESLDKRFASIATEMKTGREIWITRGPILPAARASCALPGVFSPVQFNERWMLDGGLVNPVPVSTCRALGAEVVIAVNLNAQLVGGHLSRAKLQAEADHEPKESTRADRNLWTRVRDYLSTGDDSQPGFFDVVAASVNIMQDRITRARMAGDPPDITLVPLLEDFALMDFDRAEEAIAEGRRLVQAHAETICGWCGIRAPKPANAAATSEEAPAASD